MERKLIKQGGGGLTIYLPKKWVDSKKLKEGNTVNVIERDSSLIIGSGIKEKGEIEIEINEDNKSDIKNILSHVYRKGFDKIIFNGIDNVLIKQIRKDVSDVLLGFEVTDKGKDYCIVENVSEPTEQKYDILLKRVFFIIKEMFDILLEDFEKSSFKNFDEIKDMKNNLDKNIFFCRRVITKGNIETNPIIAWELLTFLMHINHAGYYLYEYVSKNKFEKDKEMAILLKNLKDYFDYFAKAYYEKNIISIHKINRLKTKYQFGKCFELLEKYKGSKAVVVSFIREMFRLIQIGTSPVLSEILDKEYKELS